MYKSKKVLITVFDQLTSWGAHSKIIYRRSTIVQMKNIFQFTSHKCVSMNYHSGQVNLSWIVGIRSHVSDNWPFNLSRVATENWEQNSMTFPWPIWKIPSPSRNCFPGNWYRGSSLGENRQHSDYLRKYM